MIVDYGSEETQSEEEQVFSRLLIDDDLEDYDMIRASGRTIFDYNTRILTDNASN